MVTLEIEVLGKSVVMTIPEIDVGKSDEDLRLREDSDTLDLSGNSLHTIRNNLGNTLLGNVLEVDNENSVLLEDSISPSSDLDVDSLVISGLNPGSKSDVGTSSELETSEEGSTSRVGEGQGVLLSVGKVFTTITISNTVKLVLGWGVIDDGETDSGGKGGNVSDTGEVDEGVLGSGNLEDEVLLSSLDDFELETSVVVGKIESGEGNSDLRLLGERLGVVDSQEVDSFFRAVLFEDVTSSPVSLRESTGLSLGVLEVGVSDEDGVDNIPQKGISPGGHLDGELVVSSAPILGKSVVSTVDTIDVVNGNPGQRVSITNLDVSSP